MVRLKTQVLVRVSADGAGLIMGQEDVQERELPTGLLPYRELYVRVNTVQVVVERVSKDL